MHITWTDVWKTYHACINMFVYITRWRFKSLFVTQRANFLAVSTFRRLVQNATTLSFYNNLSPRLYSILLYFITLNNLYCTATSKNCTEPCDCCTPCVGLTSWVLKMWRFPYPWILYSCTDLRKDNKWYDMIMPEDGRCDLTGRFKS